MISYVKGESPLPESPDVYICTECFERQAGDEILKAPNPFNDEDTIIACRWCQQICTLEVACVVENCLNETCAGAPDRGGYRYVRLCSDHINWGNEAAQ